MNKKWFQLWNIGRLRGKMLDVLSLGRTMLLLAGGSLVFLCCLEPVDWPDRSLALHPFLQ